MDVIYFHLRASRVEGGGSVSRTVKGVTPASEMCSKFHYISSKMNHKLEKYILVRKALVSMLVTSVPG